MPIINEGTENLSEGDPSTIGYRSPFTQAYRMAYLTVRPLARFIIVATSPHRKRALLFGAVGLALDLHRSRQPRHDQRTSSEVLARSVISDLSDVTIASTLTVEPPIALVLGTPLVIDVAEQNGLAAVSLAGISVAMAKLANSSTGFPTSVGALATWPGVGICVGLGFRVLSNDQRNRMLHHQQSHLDASSVAAYIAGQNAVAMGADSVMDRLAALHYRTGRLDAGPSSQQIASGWKHTLRSQTDEHAMYLLDVVRTWERTRAGSSTRVIDIPEGEGTTLITANQVQRLFEVLDGLGPGRAFRLSVISKPSVPGSEITFDANGSQFKIAADPTPGWSALQPALLFFLWQALYALANNDARRVGAAQAGPPLIGALTGMALALTKPALLEQNREIATVLLIANALLHSASLDPVVRQDELIHFPSLGSWSPALIYDAIAPSSRRRAHAALAGTWLATCCGVAMRASSLSHGQANRGIRIGLGLGQEALWHAVARRIGRTVADCLHEQRGRDGLEFQTWRSSQVQRAFHRGHESVVSLAALATQEMREAVASATLHPDARKRAERELDEITHQLERLRQQESGFQNGGAAR